MLVYYISLLKEKDPFESVPSFCNKLAVVTFTNDQITGLSFILILLYLNFINFFIFSDFNKVFAKLDKSSSGSLDISEIGNMLRGVGMNPSNKLINDILMWFEEKSN